MIQQIRNFFLGKKKKKELKKPQVPLGTTHVYKRSDATDKYTKNSVVTPVKETVIVQNNSMDLLNPLNPLSPISIWGNDDSSNTTIKKEIESSPNYETNDHSSHNSFYDSSDFSGSSDSSSYDSGSFDSGGSYDF